MINEDKAIRHQKSHSPKREHECLDEYNKRIYLELFKINVREIRCYHTQMCLNLLERMINK